MTIDDDWRLETQLTWQIKAILGEYFITKDVCADLEEATDFAIFQVNPFRIGVRLRRYSYFVSFNDEFTLRWSRPSGVKTEIDKIREGLINYYLYGFVNEEENKIIQYFLADMKKFTDPKPHSILLNDPYDSTFAVYKLNQFSNGFILKFWQDETAKKLCEEAVVK